MKFGVAMLPTDLSLSPATLARAVEERGFESLFVPEHSHIPVGAQDPFPDGSDLPPELRQGLDPFVALTAAAAATRTLLVGTAVCLVTQRDPIQLAKETASLDVLAEGRFLFGVGVGWSRDELRDHGVDPATRTARFLEHVAAVIHIWTTYQSAYSGKYVSFEPLWSLPKPQRRPHPPVLVGGDGPTVLDRVLALGAEWMPWHALQNDQLPERIAELQRRAAAEGRGPVPVTVVGVPPDEEVIAQYAAVGVSRCVLPLPSAAEDDVLPLLDWYAELTGAAL